MIAASIKFSLFMLALNCTLPVHAQEVLPQNVGTSIPVALECPAHGIGALTIIYRTPSDLSTSRLRVEYNETIPTRIIYASAENGKPLQIKATVALPIGAESKAFDFAQRMLNLVAPIHDRICNGPQSAKERFFSRLTANRAQFADP